MQRTKQSVKNATFSIVAQLTQQLMKVLVRIAFIRVIGTSRNKRVIYRYISCTSIGRTWSGSRNSI